MNKRREEIDKKGYEKKIRFLFDELKSTEGKFNGRIAVERRLKYGIGYTLECLAEFEMRGADPKIRATIFEKAVEFYQAADETVGFLSDYALRQLQSCIRAYEFRTLAGLDGERTYGYVERQKKLIKGYFRNLNVQVVSLENKEQAKQIKKEFEKGEHDKVGDVVEGYIPKDNNWRI